MFQYFSLIPIISVDKEIDAKQVSLFDMRYNGCILPDWYHHGIFSFFRFPLISFSDENESLLRYQVKKKRFLCYKKAHAYVFNIKSTKLIEESLNAKS